ncbi:hypothetical protein, partial [Rubripirellula obstinata]|uniref:hypothetical protein n=1 Tax=Rubripirellula obstinata TaxID=406547 RepID=UPI001EE40CAB
GTHQASWSSRYSIKIRSFIKPKPGTNLSPKENHVNTKDLAAQGKPGGSTQRRGEHETCANEN